MTADSTRILIVEDDQGLAELFADSLQRESTTCTQVGNARDCVAWLATHDADLLLIDYALPDQSAPELVDRLRAAGRLRPFIVVTGHGDERVAVEMMKRGARDYLVKDSLVLERLPAVVNRTLQELAQERRLAASETALRASEVRLAEAMELAHLAHWEFDIASATFTLNDRFYALYGTTAVREGGYQMPAATYAREFLIPEEAPFVAAEVDRALAATDPNARWHIEHRIRRRDGAIRHINVQIVVLKDAAGRTVGTRGANQDITERKEAEQQLHARLAELQRWQAVMLDREDRVIQLKREVNALATRLGEPPPYLSQLAPPPVPPVSA